jgi:hypothetical protein
MQRVLTTDENVRSIETIAGSALARPLTLRVEESVERVPSGPKASLAADATPGPTTARSSTSGVDESKRALTERALKDPAVNRLIKGFGAQIVDVRPLRPGGDDSSASPSEEENG